MTKKSKLNLSEQAQLPATDSVSKVTIDQTTKATKKTPIQTKTSLSEEKTIKKEKVKTKKIKMIRDSFTLPESDYVKLTELKKKCLEAGVHVKKSELMRAGLLSLSRLSSASLLKVIAQVEIIKTGRPAKG